MAMYAKNQTGNTSQIVDGRQFRQANEDVFSKPTFMDISNISGSALGAPSIAADTMF